MTDRPDVALLDQLGRALAGRYAVIREIGRGGNGIVMLARDLALDRLVAIKVLAPALQRDAARRERFLREARLAAQIAHPHVVPVHAVEVHGDLACFVMAFVEGESLGARLRRAGPLPAAQAVRLVREVAWALAAAHARGLVHRDVKPDNILIDAASGRALVADFGIARQEGDQPGDVEGTPAYLSPEVAAGAPATALGDQYALGLVAWAATTGRLPYEARSMAGWMTAHRTAPVPSLASAAPQLPRPFSDAVDRCLARDPAARWPSADALATALEAAERAPQAAPLAVRRFLRDALSIGAETELAVLGGGIAAMLLALRTFGPMILGNGPEPLGSGMSLELVVILATAGVLALPRFLQLAVSARPLVRDGFGSEDVASAYRQQDAETLRQRQDVLPRDTAAYGFAMLGVLILVELVSRRDSAPAWHAVATAITTVLPAALFQHAMRLVRPGGWLVPTLLGTRAGRGVLRLLGLPVRGVASPGGPVEPGTVVLEVERLVAALPAPLQPVFRTRLDALRAARQPAEFEALEQLRLDAVLARAETGGADITTMLEQARRLGDQLRPTTP